MQTNLCGRFRCFQIKTSKAALVVKNTYFLIARRQHMNSPETIKQLLLEDIDSLVKHPELFAKNSQSRSSHNLSHPCANQCDQQHP